MISIYKFTLPLTDNPKILMPNDAIIHSVIWQDGVGICLYAEVDTENNNDMKSRDFIICGTGRNLPPYSKFIGTVQDPRGYVWHIFEA